MSKKLTEFLTRLATDEKLVNAYKEDKAAVMEANGIEQQHVDLLVNKKYDEIQAILGADYNIAKNSIILAFKK